MPNRILKQSICTSRNLNQLSSGAETLFYRVLVNCDDYGRFHADPAILRGFCFPLRRDVDDAQVIAWCDELLDSRLIWTYQHDGSSYLQVTKWESHQQIRAKRSKFPLPPTLCEESAAGNPEPCSLVRLPSVQEEQVLPAAGDRVESAPAVPGGNFKEVPAPCSNRMRLLPASDSHCDHAPAIAPVIQSTPIQSESESKSGAAAPNDTRTERLASTSMHTAPAPSAAPQARQAVPAMGSPTSSDLAQELAVHPAVQAWRETHAGKYPTRNGNAWETIVAAVGAEPADIERWKRTMEAYITLGWNPQNIAGMLDYFKRGDMPRAGPKAHGGYQTAKEQKRNRVAEYWAAKIAGNRASKHRASEQRSGLPGVPEGQVLTAAAFNEKDLTGPGDL